MTNISVLVAGAAGKMGREVVKTVLEHPDLTLAAAVDPAAEGEDIGIIVKADLPTALAKTKPSVMVDFTAPHVTYNNVMMAIAAGVRPVVGTTGLSLHQLETIDRMLRQQKLGGMVVPNFAIGAVLMMKFAQMASQYFDHAEIIELHHNKKLDAPSGTSLKTAELMTDTQSAFGSTNVADTETLPGARGGVTASNIHIHSVRLPGLVAHQEVLFGGPGQLLSIRHDSLDRTSFMPGVVLAIQRVGSLNGLTYGLEHIL